MPSDRDRPCPMTPRDRLIVCGFPGVGKSYYVEHNPGVHDSDSSEWDRAGFPDNYIAHLRTLNGVVLCSTHAVVRDALVAAGMPFGLVYPAQGCRDEYLMRYRNRSDTTAFIALLERMWDEWLLELAADDRAAWRIVRGPRQFFPDVLRRPWEFQ